MIVPGEGGDAPVFFFGNVPGARWFDPPFVTRYLYQAEPGTLFTAVELPPGFGDNFTLSAPGCSFAPSYTSGSLIDLSALCGGGISRFIVGGLVPAADAGDERAFPTFLVFNNPTGSFSMQGMAQDDGNGVPEPSALVLTLVAAAAGVRRMRSRS